MGALWSGLGVSVCVECAWLGRMPPCLAPGTGLKTQRWTRGPSLRDSGSPAPSHLVCDVLLLVTLLQPGHRSASCWQKCQPVFRGSHPDTYPCV